MPVPLPPNLHPHGESIRQIPVREASGGIPCLRDLGAKAGSEEPHPFHRSFPQKKPRSGDAPGVNPIGGRYDRRRRAACGTALAWASIAVPACTRML